MICIVIGDDVVVFYVIYLLYVFEGVVIFEIVLLGVEVMCECVLVWLEYYFWLVWEEFGEVLVYVYVGCFCECVVYEWIVEILIYVYFEVQCCGIVCWLYGVLLDMMCMQYIYQVVGVIILFGIISVVVYEVMGFMFVGVWCQVGYKLGQWWDVGVWQKMLVELVNLFLLLILFCELCEQLVWQV